MGKLQVFEVVFAGDDVDLFRAGEWVEGHVRIVLSEPKKDIRGIQIKYIGKGKTSWHETEGSGDDEHEVHYYAKEKYFEEKMLILGKDKKDKSGEKVHLDAGEHKFPFKFQIPDTPLPHPFEGNHGKVRYKVEAKIDRPWKFDHTTERLFSIAGAGIDLNTIAEEAQMPSKGEEEETVCCCCCASGPIKVSVQTDKTGYVPGETIWVSGFVDNQSSRNITGMTAKLVQKVYFYALKEGYGKTHHKKQYTTLAKEKAEGCDEYCTASFDRKPLLIPSCPPSGLEGCHCINIEYYIEFTAGVSGTLLDSILFLPVTIGTVPLASAYAAVFPPGQVITQQPSAPPDAPPPPSYEVAMGGLQEIPSKSGHDYTFGKLMYAPRYPYYNFPPPGDPAYPPSADPAYPPPADQPNPPPTDPANPSPAESTDPPTQGDPVHAPSTNQV